MNRPKFSVEFAADSESEIRAILEESTRRQAGARYNRALKIILSTLEMRADDCGEPLYDLRLMNLQMRTFSAIPLSVIFGVHHEQPMVFVQSVVNMQPFANE